jgi:hypothetical protein
MKARLGTSVVVWFCLSSAFAQPQSPVDNEGSKIALTVSSGTPLRLYVTRRFSKRKGKSVSAKVLDPVYAFDREVIPAGTVATGYVSRTQSVGAWARIRAILGGDFTPLRISKVEFTSLLLPDGRTMNMQTVETAGLNSIYVEPSKKKAKPPKPSKPGKPSSNDGGVLGTGKQTAMDQINGQINSRTRGIADIVRGPDKKERLVDLVMAKLPYHPQWVRRGTRFDAELRDPLEFGTVAMQKDSFILMGSQPRADSVVHARLVTALDSATAKKGEAVEAVVMQPLFSPEHQLVLPEGTRLTGAVVVARRARWFHRGGQLRFNFQGVDLPGQAAHLRPVPAEAAPLKTQASLEAAEGSGKTAIKVDQEGGVKATESKTRFIAPLISIMIANKSLDNDAGRHASTGGEAEGNVAGRTLGGASGFGLLGTALSQSSRYVGTAFGLYGMAWSVYSNVVARGGEVEFDKNAVIDIRFGSRAPVAASKFHGDPAGGN